MAGPEPFGPESPRRSMPMSSTTVFLVIFMPVTLRMSQYAIRPASAISSRQVPATIRNAAQSQIPAASRPYANAKQSSTTSRQPTNRPTTANPAAIPIRFASIFTSLLARLISYRTSCDTSLTAPETSSPSDCCPSAPSGLPLRTMASLPDSSLRQRTLAQVVQGYRP